MNLKEQQLLLSHILKVCPVKMINMWQALTKQLPSNMFNFCRKSLVLCLPTNPIFIAGRLPKTINAFFTTICKRNFMWKNCEKCLNRYTWRHDFVLNSLLQQFSKILKTSSKIYCNNNKLQYDTTWQLFTTQHPDIAILDWDQMTVIELAICFETNTLKSKEYKIKQYKDLKLQLLQPVSKFMVLFLEITSPGFISKQCYKSFAKYLKSVRVNGDYAIFKCVETTIRAWCFIFCRRNKSWTDPELLYYV